MTIDWFNGEAPYHVMIRDGTLTERTPGGGYTHLKMTLRFNDVGDWVLELPERHPGVDMLLAQDASGSPTSGIVVRPVGSTQVICSGPVRQAFRTIGGDGGITVNGLTDDDVIAGEQVYPDPFTDVSAAATTTGLGWDTRTGPAETVLLGLLADNIGPAAGIVRRRYPWLTLPPTQARGVSSTWKERFTNLLEALQRIAALGGLGFRVVQGAPGQLNVEVYEPQDRPRARFSVDAKNLTSAVVTLYAASRDETIIGGAGEGAARVFTRRGNPAGLYRRSGFQDQTSTTDLAEMQQAGDEENTKGAAKAGIQLYPVERPSLRYGVHYQLGDLVWAYNIHDRVQQVTITHDPGKAPEVTPSVGVTDPTENAATVDVARRLLDIVRNSVRR